MKAERVLALLALALALTSCTSEAEERLATPGQPVPASFFGIHNHRFHNPALRPSLPFGSWRLWDAGVSWSDLQPERARWDFHRLDFALDVARGNEQDVVLTLGRTPQWASLRPQERSFYGPGQAAPPASLDDFATYVRTVAERYRGRIRLYEAWNEPASAGMFSGSVEQMVQMTRIAAQQLAAVDPQARLICPSPAKHESLGWFRRFLAAGGGAHCSIIAYHFYTDSRKPEDKLRLISDVRQILAQFGQADKPLWDTESGIDIGVAGVGQRNVASHEAHVARWLILLWAAGIERFYWYSWDHDVQGFVHPDGSAREGATTAYRQVRQWMLGTVFGGCTRSAALWVCELQRADGGKARLVWTADNVPRTVTMGSVSRVENLKGESWRPADNTVPVGGEPILVLRD